MNANPQNIASPGRSLVGFLFRWGFRLAFLAVCIFLLLWLVWLILPWLIVSPVVVTHVDELARAAGWSRDVTGMVKTAAVILMVLLVSLVLRRRGWIRWGSLTILILLATAYLVWHDLLTRDHLFDPTGKPMIYWGLKPDGSIHKQSRPGINPWTTRPLQPASTEYLALINNCLSEPMQPVDPATHPWFQWSTGWPLLWYTRNAQGQLEFYPRPGFHPRTRVELREVTPELYQEWEKEQLRLKQEAEERATKALEEQRRQEQEQAERKIKELGQQVEELVEQKNLLAKQLDAITAHKETVERATKALEEQRRQEQIQAEERIRELNRQIQKLTQQRELLGKLYNEAVARPKQSSPAHAQPAALDEGRANARQAILDRRSRESSAEPTSLEWLSLPQMIKTICPKLDYESFDAQVFENEFAWRRFRYTGRVSWVCSVHGCTWFMPVTVGATYCTVVASPRCGSALRFQSGQRVTLVGTIAGIRFQAGLTNIDGTLARPCVILLREATPIENDRSANVSRPAAHVCGVDPNPGGSTAWVPKVVRLPMPAGLQTEQYSTKLNP